MNSAMVLLVQVRIRAVSIVMDTSGLQETALSQLLRAEKGFIYKTTTALTHTSVVSSPSPYGT